MKPFGSIVAVLGTCLVLGACMPPPPVTASKEDLLSSSGFTNCINNGTITVNNADVSFDQSNLTRSMSVETRTRLF